VVIKKHYENLFYHKIIDLSTKICYNFNSIFTKQVKILRNYGKKETSLTPVIIIINILIAGVLLLMVFFIYRFITAEPSEQGTKAPAEAAEQPEEPAEPPELLPPPEPETPEMTKATTTPPPSAGAPEIINIPDFDKEFYEDALFIGDSIMTGIHLYGHIPAGNVFARVGINPESVSYTEINGQTALAAAMEMKPARIYIMLGSNGIAFMSAGRMISDMEEFIAELEQAVPGSEIILLTIPPVTSEYEHEHPETMEKILAYNALLFSSAEKNNYFIIDTAAILSTGEGFLAPAYAEVDGLHFRSGAYKAILNYIQFTIEN
jgi:lysophospholipase L1-like esterase